MSYIGPDGTVGGRKSIFRTVTDFFLAIFNFIALFFGAVTNPPQRIEERATFGQRNSGRSYGNGGNGGNIRGVKRFGTANMHVGG